METFMSGFAQGFVRARERGEDRRAEQENLMFKYKMDNLMSMKDKRQKKQKQEEEWGNQARDLSNVMGDQEFAPIAQQELRNGVSYETIQKRIADGDYSSNDAYKAAPKTVKVPTAVSQPINTDPNAQPQTQPQAPNQTLPSVAAASAKDKAVTNGYRDPLVSTPNSPAGRRQARLEENVNKKIDSIDPDLRKYDAEEQQYSSTLANENSKYIFKPKNQMKLGDYSQARYELTMAEASKDPVKIASAKMKVDAHEAAYAEKARIDEEAKGKNVEMYFKIGDNGKIGQRITGVRENGQLIDKTDPNKPNGSIVTGNLLRVTEDDVKRLNTLRDNFAKQSATVNTKAGSLVSAMDSSQRMIDIAMKPGNQGIMTSTVSGLALLDNLQGEAHALYAGINDLNINIENKIAKNDMKGIEGMIQQYGEQVEKLNVLGSQNSNRVLDMALFNSIKTGAAYQYALAVSDDGKLSNQDFEKAMTRITGGLKDVRVLGPTLRGMANEGFLNLKVQQDFLNKDPAIESFERDMFGESKGQSGLKATRLGDIIDSMPDGEQRMKLQQFFKSINQEYAVEKGKTDMSIMSEPGNPENGAPIGTSEEEAGEIRISNDKMGRESFSKLKPGTRFIGPDGKPYIKQ